jgi:hypothetical protein
MISIALPTGASGVVAHFNETGRRTRVRAYRSRYSAQGCDAKKSTKMTLLISLKVTRRLNKWRCR